MKIETNIDKSSWGDGPWQDEGDIYKWDDVFPCLVVRSQASGALRGYVGLSKNHPMHGKEYVDIELEGGYPHGGLTFSGRHALGSDPDLWWVGFDCAHYGDVMPARLGLFGDNPFDWYCNFEYVKYEVEELGRSINAASTPTTPTIYTKPTKNKL